jgi:serine/threonine-protein kinase RsbW
VEGSQVQLGKEPVAGDEAWTGPRCHEVELSGCAQAWFVPTVRALAADLAGRADFDLDAIADMRMAVDEACVTLIRHSAPESHLRCSFLLDEQRMQVRVQVRPRDRGARLDTAGFGWRVLQSLVDEVSAKLTDDGEEQLGIHLVKRQSAHT